LVDLYNKHKDKGLVIFGFPCGQFMNQELSTEGEIKEFVSSNFKVEFPMFEKIEVNGDNTHPIYKYLKSNSQELFSDNGLKSIPWNFAKFLVDKDGKVMNFFAPRVNPVDMMKDILPLLEQ
jgi:glutathione peroxidase